MIETEALKEYFFSSPPREGSLIGMGSFIYARAIFNRKYNWGFYDSIKSEWIKFLEYEASIPPRISFLYGLPGVLWLEEKMKELNYPGSPKIAERKNEFFHFLEQSKRHSLPQGHFDIVGGMSGLGIWGAQLKDRSQRKIICDAVYSYLLNTMEPCAWGIGWKSIDIPTGECKEFSPGLSHGIAGVLMCILALKKEFPKVSPMGKDALETLINVCKDFPETSVLLCPGIESLKQGWCHGDLSVGYALIAAGASYSHHSAVETGLIRFRQGYKKFLKEQDMNLALCHGYTGVAVMLNSIAKITGDKEFKNEGRRLTKKVEEVIHASALTPSDKSLLQDYTGVFLYLDGSSEKKGLNKLMLGLV